MAIDICSHGKSVEAGILKSCEICNEAELIAARKVVEAARSYLTSRRVVAKELDWDQFDAVEQALAEYDKQRSNK